MATGSLTARLERLEQRAGIGQDKLIIVIHDSASDDELIGFNCNGRDLGAK